jgi:hypothetical protein
VGQKQPAVLESEVQEARNLHIRLPWQHERVKLREVVASMCDQAQRDYGPCRIYLDGCSSHKRRMDGIPTYADLKATIKQFLLDNKIPMDDADTKARLHHRLREQNLPRRYEVRRIAESFGHSVWYTPPYSPELQPIEKIRAVRKIRSTTPTSKLRTIWYRGTRSVKYPNHFRYLGWRMAEGEVEGARV